MLSSLFGELRRALERRRESRADDAALERIAARFPALAALPAAALESAGLLEEPYRQYVAGVSTAQWAISLRTAALLRALCALLRPHAVLDLGSGFSSFTFRLYAREAAHACTVHTIDEDAQWLDRTRNFLSSRGLQSSDAFLWTSFQAHGRAAYDLILHDMGRLELRLAALPRVLALTAADGLVILDDMQSPQYARAVRECCRNAGLELWSLRALTLDSFGRYACLACHARRA